MTLKTEIKHLIKLQDDVELNKHVTAVNDATAVTGKRDGDLWIAAFRLSKLGKSDPISYPELDAATPAAIKQALVSVVKKAPPSSLLETSDHATN